MKRCFSKTLKHRFTKWRYPRFSDFPLYAIRYNYNFGELRRGKNIIYVWWFILILIIRWLILILSFLIDHVILFFDYLHQFPFVSHMIHSNLFVWTFLRVLFSPDRSIHHLGIYYLILRTLIKSDSYNRNCFSCIYHNNSKSSIG